MNADLKHVQVRRCTTCGEIMGIGHLGPCSKCKGFVVTLGPINWTEEDEIEAGKEFVGLPEDMEQEEEDFQDVVCFLWDMIEEGEEQVIDQAAEIEELKAEIVITKNAVKMGEKEIAELKVKLEDESLKGKVKKAFGTE